MFEFKIQLFSNSIEAHMKKARNSLNELRAFWEVFN